MWNCFFFLGKFTMHSSMEHWLSFQLCPLDGAHVEAPYCESWYGCLWWWDPELICIFFFFPCCYLNLVFAQAGEGKQKQKISAQKSLNNKMMVVTILKLLAEYFNKEFNLPIVIILLDNICLLFFLIFFKAQNCQFPFWNIMDILCNLHELIISTFITSSSALSLIFFQSILSS